MEKSNAKRQNGETTESNSYTPQATSNTCEICERDFKNQGGLRIYIKRMHKEARVTFACNKCGVSSNLKTRKKTTRRHARETGTMKMEPRHVADATEPYRPETWHATQDRTRRKTGYQNKKQMNNTINPAYTNRNGLYVRDVTRGNPRQT